MHAEPSIIQEFGILLGLAAGIAPIFKRFGQPAMVGYLCIGAAVGPHAPLPLLRDPERVKELAEFGVVFVMFGVGLELRLHRLLEALPMAGLTGIAQVGFMMWVGHLLATWLGWSTVEGAFLGASLAISSTMVVSRVLEERDFEEKAKNTILSILVVQDLIGILLLAAMTGVAVSGRVQAQSVAQEVLRLAVIAAGMVIGGSWVVPRWMHLASRLNSQEVLLVTASGLCFAFAAVASHLGYSVALGAFIAGMLVAESGLAHRVEGLIGPLRDVFASIFFVSIGMTVDLRRLIEMSPAVILVAFVVIIAQSLVVTSMGLISGVGLRPALIGGLLLGQVGEFSFILASLGRSMHMVRRDLPTLLVGVSVLTVFTTPLLARASDRIVRFVDRHLPAPLRHLLVLYDQWVAALRVQYRESQNNRVRKALRALLFDGLLVVGLFAGIAKISRPVTRWVAVELGVRKTYVHVVWVTLAFVLVVGPVLWSMMRTTHALVDAVFERQGEDRRHTRALRQAFRALLLVGMALLVGFPAVTLFGAEFKSQKVLWAMALFMAALVFSTWRSAKAAGEEIQSAALSLARFLMASPPSSERASTPFLPPHLPVLGNLHSVVVQPSWACVGRSLGELNLRALTDVAVLAIQRGEKVITLPRGEEVLLAHDLLLITGTDDSVEQGIHLLRGDSQSQARGAFCANLDGILEAKEKNEYTGLSDG